MRTWWHRRRFIRALRRMEKQAWYGAAAIDTLKRAVEGRG